MLPVTGEEDDQMHELEAIDKELAELQLRKAELELEEQGERSKLGNNRDHEADLTWFESEAPRGGIYMLPHVNIDEPPEPQIPPQPLIAMEDLAETPGYTQCPTCEEYVVTNTRKKVGELAWILCCLCSMFGGVAGCCLIPFYMDSTKNFHHHCPRCQSHIHTYRQW
ncbi:lipopolysaccharide-induced tumor necrosis factor-alpha factor homolog [Mugil cephalus]|uniref:lipopolysaccharide-induced tumor necrosis factor-alpha factor homolog n=1 Tax=Mugil cephalus TaxID=48193 RepID=UPI001FB6E902|nr:lipopolysaccharide-induced tumor necrosis factor-alpha factor homolog [Mugil cephalus]